MEKWTLLITALSGLLGVAVGGILQFYTATKIEERKHLADRRKETYSTYFAAQVEYNKLNRPGLDPAEKQKLEASYAELFDSSRFGWGIYGTSEVVSSLLTFHQKIDPDKYKVDCPAGWPEAARVLQAMRNELVESEEALDDAMLYQFLYECNPRVKP